MKPAKALIEFKATRARFHHIGTHIERGAVVKWGRSIETVTVSFGQIGKWTEAKERGWWWWWRCFSLWRDPFISDIVQRGGDVGVDGVVTCHYIVWQRTLRHRVRIEWQGLVDKQATVSITSPPHLPSTSSSHLWCARVSWHERIKALAYHTHTHTHTALAQTHSHHYTLVPPSPFKANSIPLSIFGGGVSGTMTRMWNIPNFLLSHCFLCADSFHCMAKSNLDTKKKFHLFLSKSFHRIWFRENIPLLLSFSLFCFLIGLQLCTCLYKSHTIV